MIWIDIQFLVYVDDTCFIVLVKKPVYDRFLEDVKVRRDVGSKNNRFSRHFSMANQRFSMAEFSHVKTGLLGSMISCFLTLRGMNKIKHNVYIYMGVSKIFGTPKSSVLIGFSIINHPFWGTPIFGSTHI